MRRMCYSAGDLAEYKYYDMHQIVKKVLDIKEI